MKSVMKIALGICLGFTLLVVGCAAVVGSSMESMESEGQKYVITDAQFDRIKPGKKRASVERLLGKPDPEHTQTTNIDGGDAGDTVIEEVRGPDGEVVIPEMKNDGLSVNGDTVYYYDEEQQLFPTYQIVYDTNGVVTSANKY